MLAVECTQVKEASQSEDYRVVHLHHLGRKEVLIAYHKCLRRIQEAASLFDRFRAFLSGERVGRDGWSRSRSVQTLCGGHGTAVRRKRLRSIRCFRVRVSLSINYFNF